MTRKEIAVQILNSLISTDGGTQAIGRTADEEGVDPFVFAARSAIKFTDALLTELGPETVSVKTGIDQIVFNPGPPTKPAVRKPRKKKVVKKHTKGDFPEAGELDHLV